MKKIAPVLKAVATMAVSLMTHAAWADGRLALEQFLRNAQTAQGSFNQVVTNPPRQGEQVGRKKTSSGQFAIARPNKFRFHYLKPYEQLMVSDGQTLWVYDADLNQLTQKKLGEIMNGSAMAVLAGISLKDLEQSFVLTEVSRNDGLEWVRAVPRDKDSSFASIELGFKRGDAFALASMIVVDKFGQISDMRLSNVEVKPVPEKQFIYSKDKR